VDRRAMRGMTMSTIRVGTRKEAEVVIPTEVGAVDRRAMRAMTMSTIQAGTPREEEAVIRSGAVAEDLGMKILTPAPYWKIKSSSKM